MIQVRTRYVKTALDRAAIAVLGPARDRFVRETAVREAGDLALARSGAIVFLPGLFDRLRLQAVDALAREIATGRQDATGFVSHFATLWYERSFEGTIVHHEGRHALDQVDYRGDAALSDPELKYRAKISELAYSRSPRVMLSSIYGRLLGGTTGHGIANERLMADIVGWIDRHRTEVAGFDPGRLTLMQIDLLTDRQLALIARSLDPEK